MAGSSQESAVVFAEMAASSWSAEVTVGDTKLMIAVTVVTINRDRQNNQV